MSQQSVTSDYAEEENISTSACTHCEEEKKQKEFETFLKRTYHGEMRRDLKKVNDLILAIQDKLDQILTMDDKN